MGADILVYWIEKIVRTCAAGGSRTLDSLRERRTPHPLGQALRSKEGHNAVKNVSGFIVLVLCTSFGDALYLYLVSGKYLKGFQSYGAVKISIMKFLKEHNSVKHVGRVKALILCTLSDNALYFYEIS